MRYIITLLVVMVCGLSSAVEFPADVDHLNTLVNDEKQLVDAVRVFDQKELGYLSSLKGTLNPAIPEQAEKIQEAHRRLNQLKEVYETALIIYPKNARLLNYLGELEYDYFDEKAAALKAWNKAIQMDKTFSNTYNNLGLHYFHIGEYSKGLQLLDEAIRLDKKHPDYMYNMVQMYLIHWEDIGDIRGWNNKKIFREAMKLSKKLTEMQPEDFHVHQDYATNFYSSESMGVTVKWKDAAAAWEKARSLAKTKDETFYTWLNEARTWIKDENKSQAKNCLNEALQLRPDSPVAKSLLENL